jgi:hypothetical protein
MQMTKAQKSDTDPLPFSTVEAAATGDPGALRAILKHYEGYILALSVVRLYDADGNPYAFVDEYLRRELELRLITKAVGFRFRAA